MSTTVNDLDNLREIFGAPGELALACMKQRMDEYHKRFIELSPFICMATSGGDQQPFVSPKGDGPGFVKILDDTTLVIPDRRGNNKVESFTNIVANPKVSLIFFVPGLPETLRVLGRASVSTDPELLALGHDNRSEPKAATRIDITTIYFHCGKAIMRSKLWNEEAKAGRDDFPSFGKVIKEQAKLEASTEDTEALIDDMYKNQL